MQLSPSPMRRFRPGEPESWRPVRRCPSPHPSDRPQRIIGIRPDSPRNSITDHGGARPLECNPVSPVDHSQRREIPSVSSSTFAHRWAELLPEADEAGSPKQRGSYLSSVLVSGATVSRAPATSDSSGSIATPVPRAKAPQTTLALATGRRARIKDLVSQPELNGIVVRVGRKLEKGKAAGRFEIIVHGKVIAVKPECLLVVDEPPSEDEGDRVSLSEDQGDSATIHEMANANTREQDGASCSTGMRAVGKSGAERPRGFTAQSKPGSSSSISAAEGRPASSSLVAQLADIRKRRAADFNAACASKDSSKGDTARADAPAAAEGAAPCCSRSHGSARALTASLHVLSYNLWFENPNTFDVRMEEVKELADSAKHHFLRCP
mgnify:CR=1 FL=1